MRVVVADTGPLNYLVLIGESDILPKLFEAVFVPEAGAHRVTSSRRAADGSRVGRAPRSRLRTRQGFAVTGTLGVLDLAARRGLIDLGAAFTRLKATNFRCHPEIIDALLAQRPAQKT
jgi:predicted nucleic acid-binding protein